MPKPPAINTKDKDHMFLLAGIAPPSYLNPHKTPPKTE